MDPNQPTARVNGSMLPKFQGSHVCLLGSVKSVSKLCKLIIYILESCWNVDLIDENVGQSVQTKRWGCKNTFSTVTFEPLMQIYHCIRFVERKWVKPKESINWDQI